MVVSTRMPIERLPVLESSRRFEEAAAKLAVVRAVLSAPSITKAVAEEARRHDVHVRRIWEWVAHYRAGGFSVLLDGRGHASRGVSRLHPDAEAEMMNVIGDRALTRVRRRPAKVHEAVVQAHVNKGLPGAPPSYATVRRRIAAIDPRTYMAARDGPKAAALKFDQIGPSFVDITRPLELVQIDHWEADIIVVDEVERQPIGRPWVSAAIDVCTSAIVGLFVTVASPCSASTATCLSRAIKPKAAWLVSLGLDLDWPFHGPMRTLHSDSADDLVGHAVTRGCKVLMIEQQPRRRDKPQDGGHIERFFRTLAEEVQTLPGTTFSNPRERGDYDSVGNAALTVIELERYIATWVAEKYHHRRQGDDPLSPYDTWMSLQPYQSPARWDDDFINLLFLPFRRVKVTRSGIRLFNMVYQADVLRHWVGVASKDLIVSYDPRDMSKIYFFDPRLGRYFPIACRDMRVTSPTLARIKGVARSIKPQGARITPARLTHALNQLDALRDGAVAATKQSRKAAEAARRPADIRPSAATSTASLVLHPPVDDFSEGPVAPYHSDLLRRTDG